MAIRLRSGSFQWDRTVPGVGRKRETFATMAEAKAWDLKVQQSVISGLGYPCREGTPKATVAGSGTLREAMEGCFTKLWAGSRNHKHVRTSIEQLMEFFGEDQDIATIDTKRMDDLTTYLSTARKQSVPTVNRKLAVMSSVFRFAVKRGMIAAFPEIERGRETGGRIRWLSEDEETDLLKTLLTYGKADHVDAISVLLDTGVRPSELYRLKPIDVDLKTGLISIWQTKNNVPRSVPMTSRVKEIMKRRLKAGVLFPFDNNWMTPVWNRARKAMEMEDDEHFIPYICRHTCASRMVQNGVPLQVVQKWLGHASITMTEKYGHLAPDNLRAAVAVLEKQQPVTHA